MTPKHPDAKPYDLDYRFGQAEAIAAATRTADTASLNQRQWGVLKEWVRLSFDDSQPEKSTAQRMRWALHHSKPNDWVKVKTILVRRNWPRILDSLAAWRQVNLHP